MSEIELRAITGSGPGGQHVNRSATRVVLRWNVRATKALTEEQRVRLSAKLAKASCALSPVSSAVSNKIDAPRWSDSWRLLNAR